MSLEKMLGPPEAPEAGGDQAAAPQPAAPPQGGLPPTGVQQQVESINAQQQPPAPGMPQQQAQPQPGGAGTTSLGNLAQQLAQSYGLPIGRGGLVDEQGNFLMMPEQVAAQSGGQETMGSAAAKMNYIAAAITKEEQKRQQQKGIAAIQTGMGLVQSRGRGSLAAMQSGFYQDLADLYTNQEYDTADFSYFIQKEQLDLQQQIASDLREAAQKKEKWGGLGGAIGGIIGAASGIPGLGAAGAGLGEAVSGWF